MVHQYQHDPLQPGSIRLLDLLPSSRRNAPVRCRIRHVKFTMARSAYEALSYAWGAAEGSCAISCDGGELLVTPNCHDALKQLRRRYRIRTLWIDAVCIDQTAAGEPERSEQVKNMGQVYANASTVLVWLGTESLPHATTVYLLVLSIALMVDLLQGVWVILCDSIPFKISSPTFNSLRWNPKYKQAFQALGTHPWFTRVWTVQVCDPRFSASDIHIAQRGELTRSIDQELAFARRCDILFGSKQISWRHLRALMIVCDITNNVSDHDLHFEVGPMYERIRFREGARRLVKAQGKFDDNNDDFFPDWDDRRRAFLTSMTGLESKLPHDKLYGLYPILRLLSIDLPEPDYSAPIVKVAQDFTRATIASLGTLDVITSGLPHQSPAMPSWIPRDLTNPKPEAWARQGHSAVSWFFRDNGKRSKALLDPETEPSKLGVFGKRIGALRTVLACTAEPFDPSKDLEDLVRVFREWCRYADTRPDREAAIEKSFKSSGLDQWQYALLYPDCRILEPEEVAKHTPAGATEDPVTIISNYFRYLLEQSPPEVEHEKETLREALLNGKWAFVTTDSGYTGRAYRTCREEDEVWLMAGSSDPVVLRPAKTRGEFYYITPGYFYGMMDKENWPVEGTQGLEMIKLV